MMKIAVLLLVVLVQLTWSRSVFRRCKEENEECKNGVDCCPHGYVCILTPRHPNTTRCVRAASGPCVSHNEICSMEAYGRRSCCSGFVCTELCVDDNPICSENSGATDPCADPYFYQNCPRKCDGVCEQRCVPRTPASPSPPQTCLKQYKKCSIGSNQCCPGYKCREHCAEENPICFMNNVTRGCADLDFRKKCPRQCGGCERQCLPAKLIGAAKLCRNEFEGCKIGGNQCCPGYKCIDYCKREDTICSKKDASWCEIEKFRFQCPRKCGNCARCIRENVEV